MAAYSRDLPAGPLRILRQMMAAIRHGQFDPEETRSGRWRLPPGTSPDMVLLGTCTDAPPICRTCREAVAPPGCCRGLGAGGLLCVRC